jgi:PilZ domain
MAQSERRRDSRMPLAIPVRVQGHDADGHAWDEMTSTSDASHGGASFNLKHPLQAFQVVQLALPLPQTFRRYALGEQTYRVYSLVRDVSVVGAATRVGVLFIGKHPPRGYEQNPGGLYLLSTDPKPAPKERRHSQRLENLFVNLKLRTIIEGNGREESTFAENMGKGGARVMTTMQLDKGAIVEIEEMGGTFKTRAEICNIYVGQDHVARLNLHFLDEEPPDRLVSS